MSQPEARIGTAIRKYLEQQDAFIFKVHGGPSMMAGLPDLIACYRGRFVGIEVKQPGQKPTAIQRLRIKQIKDAGGIAFVATSVDDVRRVIQHLVYDA